MKITVIRISLLTSKDENECGLSFFKLMIKCLRLTKILKTIKGLTIIDQKVQSVCERKTMITFFIRLPVPLCESANNGLLKQCLLKILVLLDL